MNKINTIQQPLINQHNTFKTKSTKPSNTTNSIGFCSANNKELKKIEGKIDKQKAINILPNAWMSKILEAQTTKDYKEVRASHILVKTQEKAEKILQEINNGASFEAMAKKYSSCPSKRNGGDLDYFKKGQMVPEFEKAAFELKKGKISEPIKTQFGWHLIKVVDKK